MTVLEAINTLELHNPFLGTDENLTEAFDMSIQALQVLEKLESEGQVQFCIDDKRFYARELPQ